MRQLFGTLVITGLVIAGTFGDLQAQASAPSPGVVAGGFCTYPTGFFKTSTEAARRINSYLAAGQVGSEIFHLGVPHNPPPPYAYTWLKTGTTTSVGKGKNIVQVDQAVADLLEAIGTAGRPGAFSQNATNPTDMGTGGILAAQALALKINQGLSEVFVTPATGFSALTLVDMEGVELDGQPLTPAQAASLNGQATLQVREAVDAALGGGPGPLPYALSFAQLTDLLDLVNGSFESCVPSAFAQSHLYQPYVTSNAFFGEQRPSTVSTFAYKPAYHTFQGEVVFVGRGCPAGSITGSNPEDTYLADPTDKIALIERGGCRFDYKVAQAQLKGAAAVIIFNNAPTAGCPATPTAGSNQCEALPGMAGNNPVVRVPPPTFEWAGFGTHFTIPAAFVQRSTGLLLRDGTAPVIAFVQQ
jgi:PA domain-containing protein